MKSSNGMNHFKCEHSWLTEETCKPTKVKQTEERGTWPRRPYQRVPCRAARGRTFPPTRALSQGISVPNRVRVEPRVVPGPYDQQIRSLLEYPPLKNSLVKLACGRMLRTITDRRSATKCHTRSLLKKARPPKYLIRFEMW